MSERFVRAMECYERGEVREAEALCRKIIAHDKNQFKAKHMLGVLLLHNGQPAPAKTLIQDAIALNPRNAQYYTSLGQACVLLGEVDEAERSFHHALRLGPSQASVHYELGAFYARSGAFEQALTHCKQSLVLQPEHIASLFMLGDIHRLKLNLNEAMRCYHRIVELKPGNPHAHNLMGAVHFQLGDYGQAVICYQKAFQFDPQLFVVSINLGSALQMLGRIDESIDSYHRALQLEPGNQLVALRAATLCPLVAESNKSIDRYRSGLLDHLHGMTRSGFRAEPRALVEIGVYPAYALMYHGRDDRPLREVFGALFAPCFPAGPAQRGAANNKIGFVVTASHEMIFIRSLGGVLERLNPEAFDLTILCAASGQELLRSELHRQDIEILVMPDDIDAAAHLITLQQFTILYYWEIATDPFNYFLAFYRMAPIQCTSWGIQVTSGVPTIDYYLSSTLVEPDDGAEHYSEKLLCAKTLLTFQYRAKLPAVCKTRHDFNLPRDSCLYLFPQQIGKFHPDFDSMVAAILRQVPNAWLVILSDKWGYVTRQLQQRMNRKMSDVMERVVFLPRMTRDDYLCLVAVCDIVLDPPHYGGVNSSYDAFSFDKPVVTMESPWHIGRYTAACYRKMGFAECIARNHEEYIIQAVKLGTNESFRCAYSVKLAEAIPMLFEDAQAVHEHERLFSEMLSS